MTAKAVKLFPIVMSCVATALLTACGLRRQSGRRLGTILAVGKRMRDKPNLFSG